jgi:hypothetical protein
MRGKALAVKVLVCAELVVCLIAVVFVLGYRVRHPINIEGDTTAYQKSGPQPRLNAPEADLQPRGNEPANRESYAQKVTDPLTILTAALVAIAGIAAYVYYEQLKKMRETVALVGNQGGTMRQQLAAMEHQTAISQQMVDNAKESFYLSERAYIGLKTFKIESLLPDQSPVLKMLFINGGKTPAWNVTIQMALNVGTEPNLSRDWTRGEPTDSEAFVPAGETFNGSSIQPEPLPAKSVTAVENEIAKLFVVGVCKYKDMMKRDRVYPFCLAYKPRQRVFKHYKGTEEQPHPN